MSDHKKEFITLLNRVSPRHGVHKVFSDFAAMACYSLHNATCYVQEIEDEYLAISERYTKEELAIFPQLLTVTVNAFESRFSDFLGEIYMDLGISNDNSGQFFTPYELSRLCAKITGGNYQQQIDKDGYITVSDPACGSGGMVIAFCHSMFEAGFNYQKHVFAHCIDIDSTVAHMCFIQLSLLGVAGEVAIGNSLSGEVFRTFRTPFYYMFDWKGKLALRKLNEEVLAIFDEATADDKASTDKAPETPSIQNDTAVPSKKIILNKTQLDLF